MKSCEERMIRYQIFRWRPHEEDFVKHVSTTIAAILAIAAIAAVGLDFAAYW
jgi:hypothetical protein